MLQVEITHPDGTKRVMLAPDDCIIGKSAHNEIRLESWRVAKEHARLIKTPSGILIEDMGALGGISVNGSRIDIQYGPLKSSDSIGIGPFKLRLAEVGTEHPEGAGSDAGSRRAVRDGATQQNGQYRSPAMTQADGHADRTALAAPIRPADEPAVRRLASGRAVAATAESERRELEFEWRKRIHAILLDTMDLRRHDISSMSDERLRTETSNLIRQILQEQEVNIPAELDRDLLCTQVINEAVGLGPLEELLQDDGVSEIMVNRFDEIYVERSGRLQRHPLTFTGDRAVMGVIERIVAPLGRRIDESSPMVDARLKDGSRVNAIIPPLALKGPTLTIRKFTKRKLSVDDLVQLGAMSGGMAAFLKVCVEFRKNVVVSGGTGSGKTTLLNILSNFIPSGERVITIEDAAELKLHHEHLISLEARPSNAEGKGAVAIRDLVKNTLRMRPDRIVVGECRGAEALDMLQAMNTGHEGSLTTLHANSARDALARLETMVLMAGMDLPLPAIRDQVASAVDLIVQQTRFSCGTRLITSIAEVAGIESGTVQLQEIFKFVDQGVGLDGRIRGYFTGCDLAPGFYEALRTAGHELDMSIFRPADPQAVRAAASVGCPGKAQP